jgi:hypothetical protein
LLQEAVVSAYSLREEACAAAVVAAAVRAAQAVEVAEPEPVGSGSARDGYSAVPQAVGYCAALAQADSSEDEVAQAGCSAESAGYSGELRAADSSPGGYSVDSARDDCSVAPQATDSLRGDYSAVTALADSVVAPDGCLVVPRVADSPRADYPVDSSRDDCLVVPWADDSCPGDCSAVTALGLADFPADLTVG